LKYINELFNILNNFFLKMTWLNNGATWFVKNILRLPIDLNTTAGKIGGSVQFFIYDVIKIFILLSFLIFIFAYIESNFTPEKTKKVLGKFKGIKGNIFGALLGTVTPFCSCSSIPIFISFTRAGLPIGVTLSFLISSPFVDFAAAIVLASVFGIKIAVAYVFVGIILAVIGGYIISKLKMENQIEEYVYNKTKIDCNSDNENDSESNIIKELTNKEKVQYAKNQVKEIFLKVWKYVVLGVGIGALIHNWIPQQYIESILGEKNPFSVIIATIIAVPIYSDIFGTIPIAEALVYKGVGIGTMLSFMMGVTALSLPSIIMIKKVLKPKLLLTFIGIVVIGIIIIGYLFNIFGYIFI